MKFLQLFVVCFFFFSCAHTKSIGEEAASDKPKARTSAIKKGGNQEALFELMSSGAIFLNFRRLDSNKFFKAAINKGITRIKQFPSGEWELYSFMKDGKKYIQINSSKKYIFRMKKNKSVYGGSFVVTCPLIKKEDYKHLKKMSYFNRYNFSSSNGLCEIVIGDHSSGLKNKRTVVTGF